MRHLLAPLALTATVLITMTLGVACSVTPSGFQSKEPSVAQVAEIMATSKQEQRREESLQGSGGQQCRFVSAISKAPPHKSVVFTFDDGPTSELTPQLLEVLRKYRIRATFFMMGDHAKENPEMVRQVHSAGHLIGNHTWSHLDFHDDVDTETGYHYTPQDRRNQILEAEPYLMTFMRNPLLFRYPYGNATCETNRLLHERGYAIVGWHVDSCDWAFPDEGEIEEKYANICEVQLANRSNFVAHVVTEVKRHNGGIVLFHETHLRTVQSLEQIIQELMRSGFHFSNLDRPDYRGYTR